MSIIEMPPPLKYIFSLKMPKGSDKSWVEKLFDKVGSQLTRLNVYINNLLHR